MAYDYQEYLNRREALKTEQVARRKAYMDAADSKAAHREYYAWLGSVIGESYLRAILPERNVEVLRQKLAEDEHLNNIPLGQWDACHEYVFHATKGLPWSRSDTVCVLKEQARQVAEE
jgi:hypothetical protein